MGSEETASVKAYDENGQPPSSPIIETPILSSTSRQTSRVDLKPSPAVCPFATEQHVGKEIINCLIDCPPQKLYALIFGDPEFMLKVYAEHKYYDVTTSSWETDSITGNLKRKVTFTATLPSNVLGPSTCMVTEIQTASNQNRVNELYVVNKETTNAGIPYAENFKIFSHYCITKVITDTNGSSISSRFIYYCNVTFKKGTLFFIKNLIEKNALNGCEAMGNTMLTTIQTEVSDEIPTIRKRKKLTRKVTNSNVAVPVQSSIGFSKCGALTTLWFILILLLVAGAANMYLYKRLNYLEATTYRDWIWRRQISLSPSDAITEELDRILAEGENFYASQSNLWKGQLLHTIDALDTIAETLKKMMDAVPQMKKYSQILGGFRKNYHNINTQPLPLHEVNEK